MANKLQKIVNKPRAAAKKQKPVPVKIVSDVATASPEVDDKWRARDALSTLQRAAGIRADKPLMKAAKAEAKAMLKQLSGVLK